MAAKIVSRGDPIEPIYLNNLRVAARGWGVVSGLAVSQRGAGANMSVDIATGEAWINGTTVTKGSITNVVITAAHASYDRYDLVVINSSGEISVIDGTAAATSYANDYDLQANNAILLSEVYVPATDTTIEDAQITDKQIISFIELINAANGIAGLDANALLNAELYLVGLEEYSNHLGAVDNFTQTGTAGNGTATEDGANHEMDLDTGITINGHARFESKKVFTLISQPIIMNFIPQNIVVGAGGIRNSSFGLDADWTTPNHSNETKFEQVSDGTWRCAVCAVGACTFSGNIALVNGDLCTIVVTSSKVQFYVNRVLQFTSTTNIPTASMYFGAGVQGSGGGAATARTLSVDMMSLKRYV
jgi:hypothetical protein